ncbi:MAG: hypothetical protein WC562_00985 [Dehalococcoidia bacterium]|jgi:uncharacterized membrane-anchored protein YitT (DUF2179 family)
MSIEEDMQKLYYEQSMSAYYQEQTLLFTRLNFFFTSISFLVAALVLLLGGWTSDGGVRSFMYFSVVVLGLLLSILFLVINFYMAQVTLKKLRDHVFKMGENLPQPSVFFKSPLNVLESLDPDASYSGEKLKILIKLIRDFPSPHTWVIPLIFVAFWGLMSGLYVGIVWHWNDWWWAIFSIVPLLISLLSLFLFNKYVVKVCRSIKLGNGES